MKYFSKLKTSERISLSFALFGFVSLLVFLILINITYFFIWYSDQKELSFSEVNSTYVSFLESEGAASDTFEFREYLLDQDTMIIPDMWDLVCSPWVAEKIKESPEEIIDRLFYHDGEVLYFIYSRYFEGIGDVKIFYDTSSYIETQMTIIKTGLIFMLLVFIAQFFAGRYISRYLLKNLKHIAESVKDIDINSKNQIKIYDDVPEDDEIHILSQALNTSFETIEKQTNNLKQFLTDVSHEFKTPLMAMNTKIDLVERKSEVWKVEKTDMQELFKSFRWNIVKMNGLLESLFFLSRIEEQSSCLVKKPIKVQDFFENKFEQMVESYSHKTIELDIDIAKDLMYSVEENTFSILLENLISNAIKFSPDKGKVVLSAHDDYFSVTNNGSIITKQDQKKIWDKFYRIDTNKEGFGVWLYLVKRIINIYDWSIHIQSSKKSWTRFKVTMSS